MRLPWPGLALPRQAQHAPGCWPRLPSAGCGAPTAWVAVPQATAAAPSRGSLRIARVIDEVMGHEATSRTGQQRGSAMGAHYRHTIPEMAGRIATAIEQRLTVVLKVAEQALEAHPSRTTQRVF